MEVVKGFDKLSTSHDRILGIARVIGAGGSGSSSTGKMRSRCCVVAKTMESPYTTSTVQRRTALPDRLPIHPLRHSYKRVWTTPLHEHELAVILLKEHSQPTDCIR